MMARFFLAPSFSSSSSSVFSLLSWAAIFFVSVASEKECDVTKCPGPLRYYKDFGCRPVYKNEGDCCAMKYECDHLDSLDPNKCYANGHEYEIGEDLRDEDKNPCDFGCSCRNYTGYAAFSCAVYDCFISANEGCYLQSSPAQCCPGPQVCPEKEEDRATCEVDGKVYRDGQHFSPKSDPELNCVCQPGYKGENVEPFCMKPKRPYCAPEFRDPGAIHKKCAPVYYATQTPQSSCSLASRCQNSNDTVIHKHDESESTLKSLEDEGMMCVFGDLRMHIGDELNQDTDYSSVCVVCVCEVPPFPTCQSLPDDECHEKGPRYQPYIADE